MDWEALLATALFWARTNRFATKITWAPALRPEGQSRLVLPQLYCVLY